MSTVAQWVLYISAFGTAVIVALLVINAYLWSRYDGTMSPEARAIQQRILWFQNAKPFLLILLIANVLVLAVLAWQWVASTSPVAAQDEPVTRWRYSGSR